MTSPRTRSLIRPWLPQAVNVGIAALAGLVGLSMVFLSPAPAALATVLFLALMCLVLYLANRAGLMWRFGAANGVTMVRLALGCVLAGAIFEPPGAPIESGFVSLLALTILVLDGVDGWLARRYDTETTFGSRFDMEVDAAAILVLCILAWISARADIWVLAIGLMRYGFVAAAFIIPWLRAPLPPRLGRRVVCALQTLALAFALAPGTADQASMALALALVLLTASFARDVAWLHRRSRGPERT